MDTNGNRDIGKRLRVFAGLAVAAFAMTLAVVVGNRLSDEALAVLAGAVCGVGAAIPTSLLILSVSRRREEVRVSPPVPSQGMYPPVIVVAPPDRPAIQMAGQRPNEWGALPPSLSAPTQRQFTVVGGSPIDTEVRYEHYS